MKERKKGKKGGGTHSGTIAEGSGRVGHSHRAPSELAGEQEAPRVVSRAEDLGQRGLTPFAESILVFQFMMT